MKLVRLKAYDLRRGNVLRSYTAFGSRFMEGRWYQVDDSVATYLSTVQQPPTGNYQADDAPIAFEVVSAEEAARIDAEEARKRAALGTTASAPLPSNVTPMRAHNVSREAAKAAAEGTLTTSDLPRASKAAEVDALSEAFDDDMAADVPPPPPPPPLPAPTGGRRKRA